MKRLHLLRHKVRLNLSLANSLDQLLDDLQLPNAPTPTEFLEAFPEVVPFVSSLIFPVLNQEFWIDVMELIRDREDVACVKVPTIGGLA